MAKDQELLQAVKSHDLGAFRKLASKIKAIKAKKGGKKYNVNIQDEDGFTASHHAALTGTSEVVIGLIELECDINARDHKGMTPLHLAAWSGKVEVTRLLLEAGANVNASSDNGDTPLILACQHGNSDVADVLLDKGCNSWTTNKSGESALDLACRFGHVHVVELLLKSKEVRSILTSGEPQKTDPPLHLASKAGHVEIVRMLLEADADINHVTKNGTCLHEAALYGKTEVVKSLLEWGIDSTVINDEGHTALDEVNLFTSSKASSEIKHLLKEAAVADGTVYAKAVRDHFNMLDSTALSFKAGDTIVVLEQNQNDRWKGKIQSGEREKVGYFPGNVVRITTPRRGSKFSGKKVPTQPIVPKESFEMVSLASAQVLSEFSRNSPRLRSFGKKGPRQRLDENEDPGPIKALVEPAIPEKGLKAKKPSIKLGTGLQYVEVAVDKNPPSTQNSYLGGGQTNNKTQYTEVLLPSNGSMEEVDENADVPTLPRKNSKKVSSISQSEDIWVRNTPANQLPSLPPKTRTKSEAFNFEPQNVKSDRPPAALLQDALNLAVAPESTKPVVSPDLSRKGYEEMNLTLLSKDIDTSPASEDIWKPMPSNSRQPLAYENVSLPHREKTPNELQSMLISEVDLQEEGENGYVVVNQQSSKPSDPRSYENVTLGSITANTVTQDAVMSGASTSPVNRSYENIGAPQRVGSYVPMKGIVPDSTDIQIAIAAGKAGGQDAMDYEIMKSGGEPVIHQYVNVKRPGGAGDPLESSGSFSGLKMRDYNALHDWLEKSKLSIYIDNFVNGGFDMTSILGITAEDLTAINVNKTGHRKKILSESAKLEETTEFPAQKPVDIMTWLRLIGLEQYIPEFLDGGFDDMDFVQDMTLEDLVTIGVTKPGHQRKIWMAVNALKLGDENGNLLEQQTENVQEDESQERKGYLETNLDGDDSGVSTDEVEPENARTEDGEMDFPPPPPFLIDNVGQGPFVEDTLSNESAIPEQSAELVSGKEASDERLDHSGTPVSQDLKCDAPSMIQLETCPPSAMQEKNNIQKQADNSLVVYEMGANSSAESDDDEPPPRPPPPMAPMDISLPIQDDNQGNNSNEAIDSVKNMVLRESERTRPFSLDFTSQRPNVSSNPPPVKPKSFKKRPPPVVKPKPRKAASLSGSGDRSFSDENIGEAKSPISPQSPINVIDRRGSTGSNPFSSGSNASSPGVTRMSGSERVYLGTSNSSSSQSSVESVIEEFEKRKRSFDKSDRKLSAPELVNGSQTEPRRLSQGDAARAEDKLDEQIKQILRPGSREDLTRPLSTESPILPPLVSHFDEEGKPNGTTSVKTAEQDLTDDLMKDINNMLSDFSSELDSMFD